VSGIATELPTIQEVIAGCGGETLGQNPPLEAVERFLQDLSTHAAAAAPLRRELLREAARQLLTRAGIRLAAAMIKAAFGTKGSDPEEEDGLQGRALVLSDADPWPEPVDGNALVSDLMQTLTRFLVLPEGAALALALWTLHAHTHAIASVSPILALWSPEKRCGKTTTLYLLGALVPRPLSTANISAASVFRAIDKHRPTLLIDEADTFLEFNDELRGVLNSGHSRAGALVIRTAGDDHEVRTFSTWAPKVIAKIGKLHGTLADRSVGVKLSRRAPTEIVERLRLDRLHELEHLRQKAARWADDAKPDLLAADPEVPEALHDRAADNWRPLLAIADAAGGPWPKEARRAARLFAGDCEEQTEGAPATLLSDLRRLFEEKGPEPLSSKEIVAALVELEERPWSEWKKGKPLNPHALAKLLDRYGIRPGQHRRGRGGEEKIRGYAPSDFDDAFSRYLTGFEAVQTVHSSNGAGNPVESNRYKPPLCTGSRNGENPHHDSNVPFVPLRNPGIDDSSVVSDTLFEEDEL
jgi:putative DNA primase/helicase